MLGSKVGNSQLIRTSISLPYPSQVINLNACQYEALQKH